MKATPLKRAAIHQLVLGVLLSVLTSASYAGYYWGMLRSPTTIFAKTTGELMVLAGLNTPAYSLVPPETCTTGILLGSGPFPNTKAIRYSGGSGIYCPGLFNRYDCASSSSYREEFCRVPDDPVDKQPRTGCDVPKLGNPIIVATGNKFQTEVDYQSQAPFGLQFIRYYNSTAYDNTTDIGKKWRHSFARRVAATGTNTLVYRANGQGFTFSFDGTHWQGDVDIADTLVETVDGGGVRSGWVYTTSNDSIETYNATGQLIQINNRAGQSQYLSYNVTVIDGGDDDNATLDKVTGFTNEVMTFTYDTANRINSMTDPQGHVYSYSYDAIGNMQAVSYPDNTPNDDTDNPTRSYHYDNSAFPHHLTGRTDETGSRVTWTFDSQGRAISSELDGGVDKSSLVFNTDGSVTTTNPLGKDTTYHFETLHGVKKVTQVEGHASSSCAAANKNYTYDVNGYLASKTDWQGKTTTYIHNARGLETSRTHAFGTTEARTITTDWHADFRVPIKITEPTKVTDYSYDAQGRLISQTVTTP